MIFMLLTTELEHQARVEHVIRMCQSADAVVEEQDACGIARQNQPRQRQSRVQGGKMFDASERAGRAPTVVRLNVQIVEDHHSLCVVSSVMRWLLSIKSGVTTRT